MFICLIIIDIELTTGDGQLSTLTTSRPVTEKKRRPTAERRSMYVASMRAPLVPSASFDENDPLKLTKVHESNFFKILFFFFFHSFFHYFLTIMLCYYVILIF